MRRSSNRSTASAVRDNPARPTGITSKTVSLRSRSTSSCSTRSCTISSPVCVAVTNTLLERRSGNTTAVSATARAPAPMRCRICDRACNKDCATSATRTGSANTSPMVSTTTSELAVSNVGRTVRASSIAGVDPERMIALLATSGSTMRPSSSPRAPTSRCSSMTRCKRPATNSAEAFASPIEAKPPELRNEGTSNMPINSAAICRCSDSATTRMAPRRASALTYTSSKGALNRELNTAESPRGGTTRSRPKRRAASGSSPAFDKRSFNRLARSSTLACWTGNNLGSSQPSEAGTSILMRITSTSATASSEPATTIALVRSSTDNAIPVRRARPAGSAGRPTTPLTGVRES